MRRLLNFRLHLTRRWLIGLVIGLVLIGLTVMLAWLAGRGLSGTSSTQKREDQTLAIAVNYAQDGDLARAETRLSELGVANPAQWVVMLAERQITAGGDEMTVLPLAQLAQAMGCTSQKIAQVLVTPTPLPTATPTTAPTATPLPSPTALPPTPTPDVPTATAVPPTDTPQPPTATPLPKPQIVIVSDINVRSGPSTLYPLLGRLEQGQQFDIVARNEAGDWWQFCCLAGNAGWVSASLVQVSGPADTVAVAGDIAPPPATATPAPPTATPEPTRPPIDFVVASVRLWGVQENGGYFDGPSLHCGEKRQLRVIVQDAGGAPLNGVAVYGIYSQGTQVTGDKGPGTTEFVLGGGDDVQVVRDVDGREVSSEVARGLTTDPRQISDEQFIAGGYCADHGSCEALRTGLACFAHYSWDVVFRRTY